MASYSSPFPVSGRQGIRRSAQALRCTTQQQQRPQHTSTCIAQQQEGSRFLSDRVVPERAPGSESVVHRDAYVIQM